MSKTLLAAGIAAAAVLGTATTTASAQAQACRDYTCADYLRHDLDNYTRARAKGVEDARSPEYHQKFAGACVDSQGRAVAKQVEDVDDGRVYGGVGQATCWWSVGDADDYNKVRPQRISFLSRTGAKLQGHIWPAAGGAGKRPGVVVTTGSIQASDQMYWWAARALSAHGYNVMTFDVQGQGQSETAGHAPGDRSPTTKGVPSQQAPNFHDGTVDALRFFLSTPDQPYLPQGWTETDGEAARSASDGDELDWSNPGVAKLDRKRLGIAGHSLGAAAVSAVQQCSDQGEHWKELALCGGRSFPIRAVVAWDALSGSAVKPTVPAMSQNSDGYFLFPTLSREAPDPAESLGGFNHWDAAGLDVFSYTVRGGTHIEWSQTPYTAATTYGVGMNALYTNLWFDRWVAGSPKVRRAALAALLEAPRADGLKGGTGSASFMSARRFSAFSLTDRNGQEVRTTDIREWAGRSKVGDFAGANADTAGRVLP